MITDLANKILKAREKSIGYKLEFPTLGQNWISGIMMVDMTYTWKQHGLNAAGCNYFSIGKVTNGISERYDPDSNYYQAWIGGYLAKFKNPTDWDINKHFNLAKADQTQWLVTYGCPLPVVKVDAENKIDLGELEIDGYHAHLFQGGIWSNTDMGTTKGGLLQRFKKVMFPKVYNIQNPHLKLTKQNLVPNWNENIQIQKLSPYQHIRLEGFVAIVDISANVKAVLYGNGAIYKDVNGIEHNTYEAIKDELLDLIKAAKITKVEKDE